LREICLVLDAGTSVVPEEELYHGKEGEGAARLLVWLNRLIMQQAKPYCWAVRIELPNICGDWGAWAQRAICVHAIKQGVPVVGEIPEGMMTLRTSQVEGIPEEEGIRSPLDFAALVAFRLREVTGN
jgi:hypothetical protein